MPLTSVSVSASPNPSGPGNTVTFSWTANGFPNLNVVTCNDDHSPRWLVNGSWHGSFTKTVPGDFYANFTWRVTCTDDNFYGTGSVDVVNVPAPCDPEPEWVTSPTISGTPRVGYTVSSSSGAVWCTRYLRAHFERTDAKGNLVATPRDGPVQDCGTPGYVNCSKSDAYTLTSADVGYYIRTQWEAWRPPPSPSGAIHAWTTLIGPITN